MYIARADEQKCSDETPQRALVREKLRNHVHQRDIEQVAFEAVEPDLPVGQTRIQHLQQAERRIQRDDQRSGTKARRC